MSTDTNTCGYFQNVAFPSIGLSLMCVKVVKTLYPDSIIEQGVDGHIWAENATEYAQQITHSRYLAAYFGQNPLFICRFQLFVPLKVLATRPIALFLPTNVCVQSLVTAQYQST